MILTLLYFRHAWWLDDAIFRTWPADQIHGGLKNFNATLLLRICLYPG